MATQTGTLKAGNQLVIDSQGASVDYDVSVTGYAVDFKRIQQENTLSLGPHKVDCTYSVTVNSGSPSIYKVQPNGQREYTAATLPDPAKLGAGATVVVTTPYGENVAAVVNGAFRYVMPFVTTWVGRPPASSVPVGTELQVTDYANQKWVSDGTDWRPAQGRVLIGQQWGRVSQPLASFTGVSQGYFTIPGGFPLIKAGMIIPHSRVYAEAHCAKAGSASGAVIHLRLGAVGVTGFPDNAFGQINLNTPTMSAGRIFASAKFGTSMTSFIADNRTPPQGQLTELNDKISGVNAAADMEVAITLTAASAADTISFYGYNIWLEA